MKIQPPRAMFLVRTLSVLAIGAAACGGEDDGAGMALAMTTSAAGGAALASTNAPPAPTAAQAEETLLGIVASFGHPMRKLTTTPVPSVAAPSSLIDLWVSEHAADVYDRIKPGKTSSHMELPTGMVVVRAVRNKAGALVKTTVLEKRYAGYNPPSDLWFASYETNGRLSVDANGAPIEGTMPACNNCHLARSYDAYVFGMPTP